MIRTNLMILLLTGTLTPAVTIAADAFPGIEKIMTPEEQKDAGLHKLTPAELKALNDWLRTYSAGTTQAAKVETRAEVVREVHEQETAAKQAERIVSQVQGEFTGWNGKTIFHLKNGQVWQQRSSGQLYHKAQEPKVEITRNLLGYYVMHVVGTSYSVGVKRIN